MELVRHLPDGLAPLGWGLMAWIVIGAVSRMFNPAARAGFLPLPLQQHAWLAGIVGLGVLWSLQINVGGLHLTMVGVPLYALLFGRDRAILGAAIALAGLTYLTNGVWAGIGAAAVARVALPAFVATLIRTQLGARLPHNVFVFIIGNGQFATLVAAACGNVAALALQMAMAAVPVQNPGEIFGYALLLAWGEALVAGMTFSALVIFRPQAVMTYSQDDYLPRR
jgi:uncharacterized membrane protein